MCDVNILSNPTCSCDTSSFNQDTSIRLKQNVSIIVAGMLIRNDPSDASQRQVLMIQEAKESCRGKWYMPAGRLERNETLVMGISRELEEESGLTAKVVSLVTVETGAQHWYRYCFLLGQLGGKLKSPEEADEESIQAAWFPVDDVLKKKLDLRYTRAFDVSELLKRALAMYDRFHSASPCPIVPVETPRCCLATSVCIVNSEKSRFLSHINGRLPFIHFSPHELPNMTTAIYELFKSVGSFSKLKLYTELLVANLLISPGTDHDGAFFCLLIIVEEQTVELSTDFVWTDIGSHAPFVTRAIDAGVRLVLHPC